MPYNILIVDDNRDMRAVVRAILEQSGFSVGEAGDASEGLRQVLSEKFDLVLLDIMMPGMDGLTMLSRLREKNPHLLVIIMTAYATPRAAVEALREQACDFLNKPFDAEQLISAVRTALALREEEFDIEVLSARPEWIEISVPCTLAAIDPLERIMTQLTTELPQKTRENVTYAFREMLRNAIEHGGKYNPTQRVEIGFLHTPRIILYRIKDPGEGFNIESLLHAAILNPPEDPMRHEQFREQQGMRPGGFGILIAQQMVDEMVYNERHNEVILIKYLS
ncbi:MAG TPA: response regulator [Pyrinomonadaceae bacterium]|nr:response regulator [Pyrinomonadaceae bacterium]